MPNDPVPDDADHSLGQFVRTHPIKAVAVVAAVVGATWIVIQIVRIEPLQERLEFADKQVEVAKQKAIEE